MIKLYVSNESGENYNLVLFGKWFKLPFKLENEDFTHNDCAMSWGLSAFKDGSKIFVGWYWKDIKWGKNFYLPIMQTNSNSKGE